MSLKKIILGVVAIIILIIALFGLGYCHNKHIEQQEEVIAQQQELWGEIISDTPIPEEWYKQDGYDNVAEWWTDIQEQKQKYSNIASETYETIGEYLTEEQVKEVQEISDSIQASHSQKEISGMVFRVEEITAEGKQAKEQAEREEQARKEAQANQTVSYNGNNFKSQGVINANGYRYTWYSSNDLYHRNTPQWSAGNDGVYRDSNGYVIVASSDHKEGTLVPTPFGQGIVRDSGCASGTLDIYTNF